MSEMERTVEAMETAMAFLLSKGLTEDHPQVRRMRANCDKLRSLIVGTADDTSGQRNPRKWGDA